MAKSYRVTLNGYLHKVVFTLTEALRVMEKLNDIGQEHVEMHIKEVY